MQEATEIVVRDLLAIEDARDDEGTDGVRALVEELPHRVGGEVHALHEEELGLERGAGVRSCELVAAADGVRTHPSCGAPRDDGAKTMREERGRSGEEESPRWQVGRMERREPPIDPPPLRVGQIRGSASNGFRRVLLLPLDDCVVDDCGLDGGLTAEGSPDREEEVHRHRASARADVPPRLLVHAESLRNDAWRPVALLCETHDFANEEGGAVHRLAEGVKRSAGWWRVDVGSTSIEHAFSRCTSPEHALRRRPFGRVRRRRLRQGYVIVSMVSGCTIVDSVLGIRIEDFDGGIEPRRRKLAINGVGCKLEHRCAAGGAGVQATRHEAVAEAAEQLVMHGSLGKEVSARAPARSGARPDLNACSPAARWDGTRPRRVVARPPTAEGRGA